MKPLKTAMEIKELVADELRRRDPFADVDPDSLIVVGAPSGWMATVRCDGQRLDEATLAAVAEISRCLATGFDFAPC